MHKERKRDEREGLVEKYYQISTSNVTNESIFIKKIKRFCKFTIISVKYIVILAYHYSPSTFIPAFGCSLTSLENWRSFIFCSFQKAWE